MASAAALSGLLEAYWQLAAARFVDLAAMQTGRVLGRLPEALRPRLLSHFGDDHALQVHDLTYQICFIGH